MKYSLVVLRRAENDSDSIVQWLEQRSQKGAHQWREAFHQALGRILTDPFRWSKVAEADRLPSGLRQYLFHTRHGNVYRIVYFVEADEVRILRIRSPGQRRLTRRDVR